MILRSPPEDKNGAVISSARISKQSVISERFYRESRGGNWSPDKTFGGEVLGEPNLLLLFPTNFEGVHKGHIVSRRPRNVAAENAKSTKDLVVISTEGEIFLVILTLRITGNSSVDKNKP
jgi:hypothetical protein